MSQSRERLLEVLEAMVKLFGVAAGPDCEVVLHDLAEPEHSIVTIANGHVTGRTTGDPIIGGPASTEAMRVLLDGKENAQVLGPYENHLKDGRRLRSCTALFRDPGGDLAVCVNFDLTRFELLNRVAQGFLSLEPVCGVISAPAHEVPTDVDKVMEDIVAEVLGQARAPAALMSRDDKLACVESLYGRGVFLIKGSVERVAEALGVSRFTIYGYLDEIKARSESSAKIQAQGLRERRE